MQQKKSRMGTLHKLPPYTIIICEGVKTEPLYLKGFVKKINEKYKEISRTEHIIVYGIGRNTKGLLEFVDQMVDYGGWDKYERFWLVYDKDDFPYDNFDNTQFSAEKRKGSKIMRMFRCFLIFLAGESKIQEGLVNGWMLREWYKILIRERYMIMGKLFSLMLLSRQRQCLNLPSRKYTAHSTPRLKILRSA